MNFVHDTSTSELPQVARGPIPVMQWDMWVDSGDAIVMVADAPDEVVKEDATARWEWVRGKTIEWFGSTVRLSKIKIEWIESNKVAVRGVLSTSV